MRSAFSTRSFHIYVSEVHFPAENLRIEQQLLTDRIDNILLFYRNNPSVVVGKHQVVEAEVNLSFCTEQRIEVIKRQSGGGTVYHDLGNVNWSFISNRTDIALLDSNPTKPIVDLLRSYGLNASVGARNEIRVDDRKVSGTAAQIRKTRQLFHGTLLHNTDLTRLDNALKGDASKRGKGVASIPSQVVNLSEYAPFDCSTEAFLDLIIDYFQRYYKLK